MYIDKLHYLKKILLEEKKKLTSSLNNMNNMEDYGSMDIYHSDISGYDNHPADIGTEVFMMEQDNGFKNRIKDTLYEIDSSLEAIKNGSYGICESCKREIDYERLKLLPYIKTSLVVSPEKFLYPYWY